MVGDDTFRVWDATTGKEWLRSKGMPSFSPDGRKISSWSPVRPAYTFRIWDVSVRASSYSDFAAAVNNGSVKELVQKEPNLIHDQGDAFLVQAAKEGDVDTVKALLAYGVNPMVKEPNIGFIPVIIATMNLENADNAGRKRYEEVIRYLYANCGSPEASAMAVTSCLMAPALEQQRMQQTLHEIALIASDEEYELAKRKLAEPRRLLVEKAVQIIMVAIRDIDLTKYEIKKGEVFKPENGESKKTTEKAEQSTGNPVKTGKESTQIDPSVECKKIAMAYHNGTLGQLVQDDPLLLTKQIPDLDNKPDGTCTLLHYAVGFALATGEPGFIKALIEYGADPGIMDSRFILPVFYVVADYVHAKKEFEESPEDKAKKQRKESGEEVIRYLIANGGGIDAMQDLPEQWGKLAESIINTNPNKATQILQGLQDTLQMVVATILEIKMSTDLEKYKVKKVSLTKAVETKTDPTEDSIKVQEEKESTPKPNPFVVREVKPETKPAVIDTPKTEAQAKPIEVKPLLQTEDEPAKLALAAIDAGDADKLRKLVLNDPALIYQKISKPVSGEPMPYEGSLLNIAALSFSRESGKVIAGRLEIVKFLLEQGADPTVKDGDGFPPVFLAAIASVSGQTQKEIALYLWANGSSDSLEYCKELSLKQQAMANIVGSQTTNQWVRERIQQVDAAVSRLDRAKNGVNKNDYVLKKVGNKTNDFYKRFVITDWEIYAGNKKYCFYGKTAQGMDGLYASLHKLTVRDEDLDNLAKAIPNITNLNLQSCGGFTDIGLKHVGKMKHIDQLWLVYNDNISDDGIAVLAELPKLESLRLVACKKITDDGLRCLQNLTTLKTLDIGSNQITGSGLQYLGKLTNLKTLQIQYSKKLADKGLSHLKRVNSLESLNLAESTEISDAGLEHLTGLSNLKDLNVNGCPKITEGGLDKLRVALPNCKIYPEKGKVAAENDDSKKSDAGSFSPLDLMEILHDINEKEKTINEFTSIPELQQYADKGDPAACYELGRHYRRGSGGCEKDVTKGSAYYQKGAESDTPTGWYCKATCHELGIGTEKDEPKALECYKKAAERGDVRAQRQLGFCYQDGTCTGKDDYKAFEWFQKAAEQGDADSQANLGWYYQNGIGTSKNERKAVYWYQKAAEQGHMVAQCNLGYCYDKAIGTPVDIKMSFYWLQKSAEQGFQNAQFNMGNCYKHGGPGGTPLKEQAAYWYRKAYENEQGGQIAVEAKKELEKLGY